MAPEATRGELQELKARVAVLEDEVAGEKTVSRYILEQTRRNGDDLAVLKSRMDRFDSEIRKLRDDLPGIVAETMREVLSERDGQ